MRARLGVLVGSLCVSLLCGDAFAGPRGGGRGGASGPSGAGRGARPSSNPSGKPNSPSARPENRVAGDGPAGKLDRTGPTVEADRIRKPVEGKSIEEFLGGNASEAALADRQPGQGVQTAALYAPDSKPFTAEWYRDHPNAWQATHPHADAWAVATGASLVAWLALPVAAWDAYGTSNVIVESEGAAEEPAVINEEQLADSGAAPVSDDTEWMTIGVYSLIHDNSDDPTRIVQLELSKEGVLRGTHYDLISEQADVIQGAVDKKSLTVAWKVGSDGRTTFQTALPELTDPTANVTLRFPNGTTSTWKLVAEQ